MNKTTRKDLKTSVSLSPLVKQRLDELMKIQGENRSRIISRLIHEEYQRIKKENK